MPRLIEVQFAGYSARLRPHLEGVRAVAPDAVGSASDLLGRAVHQTTGGRPAYCWQSDTWAVPLEKLTPEACRRIAHTFQKLLLQEQRRLSDLAEALGDPRPAPEPAHAEEEAEVWTRMPPDPEEELRRFREEVDRMLRRGRPGSARG
jgi:hypothetical protein